jgi:hypothetical protein
VFVSDVLNIQAISSHMSIRREINDIGVVIEYPIYGTKMMV